MRPFILGVTGLQGISTYCFPRGCSILTVAIYLGSDHEKYDTMMLNVFGEFNCTNEWAAEFNPCPLILDLP